MYAGGAAHSLRGPCLEILDPLATGRLDAVTSEEVIQEIFHRFARSPHSARDLIHVATCLAHGIEAVVSPNTDFDRIREVRRIAPEDPAGLSPHLRR
jgi:predicted nucleic acid-binding protein